MVEDAVVALRDAGVAADAQHLRTGRLEGWQVFAWQVVSWLAVAWLVVAMASGCMDSGFVASGFMASGLASPSRPSLRYTGVAANAQHLSAVFI